jgi:(3S)-linalool synthase
MSAAPARIIFSSSVGPLLLAASPAAAGNSRQGRHRGEFIRPLAASNMLLRNDFDLQVA